MQELCTSCVHEVCLRHSAVTPHPTLRRAAHHLARLYTPGGPTLQRLPLSKNIGIKVAKSTANGSVGRGAYAQGKIRAPIEKYLARQSGRS